MLSFGALADEESIASNESSLLNATLEGPRNLDSKQALLSKRLKKLKDEVAWHEDEITRLKSEAPHSQSFADTSSVNAFVKALLSSNDSAVIRRLSDQERERQQWQREDEDSTYNTYYPVRSGQRAQELLGLFHCLTFIPLGVNMETRNIHVTRFRGFCSANNKHHPQKLFTFRVSLRVNIHNQSVDSFNLNVSPWVTSEIGSYLESQNQNLDIFRSMHGLAEYGNIALKRYAVFEKLSNKYDVTDNLWRKSPRLVFAIRNGIQLYLTWRILYAESSDEPVSQISVTLNYPLSSLPKWASTLPEVFASLMNKYGTLRATCIVHEVVYNQNKPAVRESASLSPAP